MDRRKKYRYKRRKRRVRAAACRLKVVICILLMAVLLGGGGYFADVRPTDRGADTSSASGVGFETGLYDSKSEEASSKSNGAEAGASDSGADPLSGTPKDEAGVVSEGPVQTPEPEITLVMVGDILLHTRVAKSGELPEGGYDFGAIFSQVKEEIAAADLALVNQEVIIGGADLGVSGYPTFNAPFELGEALEDAGFDVVLHATNHALDKGKRGIQNCLAFWEGHPDMAVLGIHGSKEAQEEIYVYEQEGIRIAVLNYTYGTNGIALPKDMPYAVDMLEKTRVEADLGKARELADFVVVCPHWGTEYTLEATKEQREWAKFFAENGADLVLGTHPHVLEPVEWVSVRTDTEDGGFDISQDTLVYYSLGNFVNWTSGTGAGVANRMVGGMAKVVIGRNEAGETVIKSYAIEPLVCHVEQGFGGVTVYPLKAYTQELAARNEIVSQDGSFTLEYCRKLVEKVLGAAAGQQGAD